MIASPVRAHRQWPCRPRTRRIARCRDSSPAASARGRHHDRAHRCRPRRADRFRPRVDRRGQSPRSTLSLCVHGPDRAPAPPSHRPRSWPTQNEFPQPKIQRLELRGRIAHPECQRRALDRDALAQQNLGLAIERQMPSIFGNQDRGHHRLGRQPAFDQPFRRWAWTTACSQARQPYWGRCVTITRYWAGITSRRSAVSSPMTCIVP